MTELRSVIPHSLERQLQSWNGLIERLPIGVYTCDAGGRIVQFNRRAAELWGRSPALASDSEQRFCGAWRLFRPDGTPLSLGETPMAEVLRTGRPLRDGEVIVCRPDRSEVAVLVNIDPLFDDAGRLAGAVTCFQDIGRRVAAERRLNARERWFQALLEALPAPLYTTDALGRITFYNDAAAALWGRRPALGSAQWCGSWKLYRLDGSALPHDQCPMALALKEGRAVRGVEAVAERPDGTRVPFMPFPTPLRDEAGDVVGAVNMLVDLSQHKADQVALAAEARRLRVLLDELDHRVRNTLATVQSLAAQTFNGGAVPRELRQAFEGRLHALSRTHTQLSRGGWESADLGSLLEDLLGPYRGGGERVRLAGAPVRVAPQAALILAMVLHELAANAAKYGALSRPEGRLDIAWSAAPDRRIDLTWAERGGPPVSPPARRGFGSRLLERGIVRQLKGAAAIDFAPGGVRCAISVPLAAAAA